MRLARLGGFERVGGRVQRPVATQFREVPGGQGADLVGHECRCGARSGLAARMRCGIGW